MLGIHYPTHNLACPSPVNLREAETGDSVASLSACAGLGNSGVRGTAAELPPQFRDLSITQAWVDLEHHQQPQRRSRSGRRRARLRFLSVTVTLYNSETRLRPDPQARLHPRHLIAAAWELLSERCRM